MSKHKITVFIFFIFSFANLCAQETWYVENTSRWFRDYPLDTTNCLYSKDTLGCEVIIHMREKNKYNIVLSSVSRTDTFYYVRSNTIYGDAFRKFATKRKEFAGAICHEYYNNIDFIYFFFDKNTNLSGLVIVLLLQSEKELSVKEIFQKLNLDETSFRECMKYAEIVFNRHEHTNYREHFYYEIY